MVRTLIYPVPDPRFPFLGVHWTRSVHDQVHAGPSALLAFAREGYRMRRVSLRDLAELAIFPGFWRLAARHWRTGLREIQVASSRKAFARAARELVPEVRDDDLVAAPSGVRAQAVSRDGHSLLAFNDLFIGAASHVSARYELQHAGKTERQSSSGIIVSTGAGSTGWLRSVLTGARSIEALANGRAAPSPVNHTLPWDTSDLIYCVREPFPSKMSGTTLAYGMVNSKRPLEVTSHMASGGVIFSDGIQSDAIPFETGSIVSVGVAEQQAHLVVQ